MKTKPSKAMQRIHAAIARDRAAKPPTKQQLRQRAQLNRTLVTGETRFSVVSSVSGCLESRAIGQREARRIAREHKRSIPGAVVTILQWDIGGGESRVVETI